MIPDAREAAVLKAIRWRILPLLFAGYFAYRAGIPQHVRLFLTTGILGGFTTFSTFSLDAAVLIERHQFGAAVGYVVGSVAAGLAGLFFGLAVFRSAGHLP